MGEVVALDLWLDDKWVEIGSVALGDPLGTITDRRPQGHRELLVFGWIDGRPVVARPAGGLDVELPGSQRCFATEGLIVIAELVDGPHMRCVQSDAMIKVRWVLRPR